MRPRIARLLRRAADRLDPPKPPPPIRQKGEVWVDGRRTWTGTTGARVTILEGKGR